ncbi:fasciclin domain-containing protein [Sphaerisporangium sp. TRM90804]|uniref:fasciclin domain-containing protein n=1 Tax=Sphaerisporangium sp. TRM90804 TaxID=3031113 RepID=UPI002449AB64|nr:fasciclin domain-containing protein [Sphaerisporangium sp. TRM90804]MDH2426850.1 fasciclin domain-containing protein [Sphaerisporangium sp. TRM90804]
MKHRMLALAALAAAVSLTAACGGDSGTAAQTAAPSAPATAEAAPAPATETPMAAAAPFGAACSAVPDSGAGSFSGMAQDPVATAASNNPVLSTLVTAVTKAGLVDTLNSAPDITVFAPTNDAFAKLPKATLEKVLADKKMLTSILTYHVVGSRQTPTDLENGSLTTLQGGMLSTSGSGESYKVGDADVVCGGVQTRNATVYIIDTVLMPK